MCEIVRLDHVVPVAEPLMPPSPPRTLPHLRPPVCRVLRAVVDVAAAAGGVVAVEEEPAADAGGLWSVPELRALALAMVMYCRPATADTAISEPARGNVDGWNA